MNGRICISIFRTTRLSIALSFRSGMYVESIATFCSAVPWSRSVPPMMVTILVPNVIGLTQRCYVERYNATS